MLSCPYVSLISRQGISFYRTDFLLEQWRRVADLDSVQENEDLVTLLFNRLAFWMVKFLSVAM